MRLISGQKETTMKAKKATKTTEKGKGKKLTSSKLPKSTLQRGAAVLPDSLRPMH